MDWTKLLALGRLCDPNYIQSKHRPVYTQDIDRILFSPPFRRLANKTQVHPLYDNDHIHHRLIHSLEVASVGRSLGIEVGAWLADERCEISGDQVEVIAGLVQTACMAHDIGNPPFGHSGEEAIASWFRDKFEQPVGIFRDISEDQRAEFEAFEGNAQGFRILTRTEMYKDDGGLRLAYGSLAAFTKYPVAAPVKQRVGPEGIVSGNRYIGLKKYGFFLNDVSTFERVADEVGLPKQAARDVNGEVVGYWWRRHPLAFLMEAADDICYNIMDLEDAYLCGDVGFEQVISLLAPLVPKSNKIYPDQGEGDVVSRHRALGISGALSACIDAFKENYDDIMAGNFAVSLVEASSKATEFKNLKAFAWNRIFNARRKTELEVYGRNIIYRTLDGLLPLVDALASVGGDSMKLGGYHVGVVRALGLPAQFSPSAYDALHILTDFVSGMTDRYAVRVADMLGKR